jgi:hypothetical protein
METLVLVALIATGWMLLALVAVSICAIAGRADSRRRLASSRRLARNGAPWVQLRELQR